MGRYFRDWPDRICSVGGPIAVVVFVIVVVAGFLFLAALARADEACARHLPLGRPKIAATQTTPVCHAGYFALHDDVLKDPRYVTYLLKGADTLCCGKRADKFHAEAQLRKGGRATPADYKASGFDKGHQAPAADMTCSSALSRDSFSMVNMAPQVGGLNRQEWERLEETVRAWAWRRGELLIFVGPIFSERPRRIGKNRVAVPAAFWKVLVDLDRAEALAFIMPNRAIRKGPLEPWQVTVADVEDAAGVRLPLPSAIDVETKPKLWRADIAAWTKTHNAACRRR